MEGRRTETELFCEEVNQENGTSGSAEDDSLVPSAADGDTYGRPLVCQSADDTSDAGYDASSSERRKGDDSTSSGSRLSGNGGCSDDEDAGQGEGTGEEVNGEVNGDADDGDRPRETFMNIIATAIMSSDAQMMILPEIYDFLEKNYSYYRQANRKAWQNAVRHNLSLHDCFLKVPRYKVDLPTTSCYWKLTDKAKELYIQGQGLKRAAGNSRRRSRAKNKGKHAAGDKKPSLGGNGFAVALPNGLAVVPQNGFSVAGLQAPQVTVPNGQLPLKPCIVMPINTVRSHPAYMSSGPHMQQSNPILCEKITGSNSSPAPPRTEQPCAAAHKSVQYQPGLRFLSRRTKACTVPELAASAGPWSTVFRDSSYLEFCPRKGLTRFKPHRDTKLVVEPTFPSDARKYQPSIQELCDEVHAMYAATMTGVRAMTREGMSQRTEIGRNLAQPYAAVNTIHRMPTAAASCYLDTDQDHVRPQGYASGPCQAQVPSNQNQPNPVPPHRSSTNTKYCATAGQHYSCHATNNASYHRRTVPSKNSAFTPLSELDRLPYSAARSRCEKTPPNRASSAVGKVAGSNVKECRDTQQYATWTSAGVQQGNQITLTQQRQHASALPRLASSEPVQNGVVLMAAACPRRVSERPELEGRSASSQRSHPYATDRPWTFHDNSKM